MDIVYIDSIEKLQELDDDFSELSTVQKDPVLEEFLVYFSKSNNEKRWRLRYGYYRWYVLFVFNKFGGIEKDYLNAIVGNDVAEGILLNYDLLREYLWYLGLRAVDDTEMQSLHGKCRDAFISSDAIIGTWQGKTVTLAETVKQMDLIRSYNYDSIKMAEFESRLKQIMFPKPDSDPLFYKYFTVDPDVAVQRLVDVMDFFLSVEPDEIAQVVEDYLKTETQENVEKNESTPVVAPGEVVSPSAVADIRARIDAQFKKDAAGDYEDIEGVFGELENLAEKYHDPQIAAMLYWDETQEKFIWQK